MEHPSNYSLTLEVVKPINKGEEMFVDYGKDYFGEDEKGCPCSSEDCKARRRRLLEPELSIQPLPQDHGPPTHRKGRNTRRLAVSSPKSALGYK